eukprot:1722213-Rhodomonas_salina.1
MVADPWASSTDNSETRSGCCPDPFCSHVHVCTLASSFFRAIPTSFLDPGPRSGGHGFWLTTWNSSTIPTWSTHFRPPLCDFNWDAEDALRSRPALTWPVLSSKDRASAVVGLDGVADPTNKPCSALLLPCKRVDGLSTIFNEDCCRTFPDKD